MTIMWQQVYTLVQERFLVELQLECWKPKLKHSDQPHCVVNLESPIPR